MIYLTYNDLPSGIYNSQVIDVCAFLKKELNANIQLVALISMRGYFKNRKKIKTSLPDSIVLPMFPKHKNWKWNILLLRLLLFVKGKQELICRGLFTTNLALMLKQKGLASKVIFDARGAYKAEFEEYLNRTVHLKDSIKHLESEAVMRADFRLAVSQKLVDYWREKYGYAGQKHVVIPCTLSNANSFFISEQKIIEQKQNLGYNNNDIILLYSGSSADWQSVGFIDDFLLLHLNKNPFLKVIFLAKFNLNKLNSYRQFPDRIAQQWLPPDKVQNFLPIADYGLLIREASITNKVASPTKFAEYLLAGLKVIISPDIGDFSDFVQCHNAGIVYKENNMAQLQTISYDEKQQMNLLAISNFTKDSFRTEYQKITT